MAAKAHYGELRCNNANKLIVGEFVRKWFRDNVPDIRNIDIIRHTPMAVELALTPSFAAVEAQDYARSVAVQRRRGAVDLPK